MLETMETTREKMNMRLGFTPFKSGLDVLRREDYVTEDDFLNAVAAYNLEHNNKEFVEAKRRAKIEYDRRVSEQAQAAVNAAMQKAAEGVTLTELDERNAERTATEKAQMELAQGRINAREYGGRINELFEEEKGKAKLEHVNSASMSAAIREMVRQSRNGGSV